MLEAVAALLVLAGGFFCLVAGIGVVRLGDVYARMHAATKAGTLGLAFVAAAMMLVSGTLREVIEPLLVFLFMITTAPVGAHLIGRAVFRTGVPVSPKTRVEDGCRDFLPGRRPTPPRSARTTGR